MSRARTRTARLLLAFFLLAAALTLSGAFATVQADDEVRTVWTPTQAAALAQRWVQFKSDQIAQWRGATVGTPVVYYDLDGAPTAYVVPVQRGSQDAGYVTLTYEVRANPVVEFSANPAPHLRDTAAAPGLTLDRAHPITLGPLDYCYEAVSLDSPQSDARRRLVPMGGKQVIEIEHQPRATRPRDVTAATVPAPADLPASSGTAQIVRGVPDYDQFYGPDYGYTYPCYSGCTPTSATNMAYFWAAAGYPNLSNPNWRDTVLDIRTRMETHCSGIGGRTYTSKASPGLVSFAQSRGYSFASTQYCWPNPSHWLGCTGEFTWGRYTGEIDQCRPTLLSILNHPDYGDHSVTGVGYDTAGGTYYVVHDNWPSTPQDVWVLHEDVPNRSRFLHTFIPPNPLNQTPPSAIAFDPLPAYCHSGEDLEISWSSATDAYPGLVGYDLQLREGADGPWNWVLMSYTSTTTTLFADFIDGYTYYFRVLAADRHCNTTAWATAANGVTGDAAPPITAVDAQPRYRTETSFPVSWRGDDAVSGVASYRIQVNPDSSGWSTWQSNTTATSDTYTGATVGSTYQFRSLGTDQVGHQESKDTQVGDTTVTIARFGIHGRVLGNRGQPAFQSQVSSAPTTYAYNSPTTVESLGGTYSLFFSDRDVAAPWVDITARPVSGPDLLPPMKQVGLVPGVPDVNGVDLVLPPPDNVVQNSHFEDDLSTYWSTSGPVLPTRVQPAHTGDYAVLLGALPASKTTSDVHGDAPWQWAISQAATVPSTMQKPTLSWMYAISGTASPSDTLVVAVTGLGAPLSYTVPLTGAGWQHDWLALDETGGTVHVVTVSFALHRLAISDTLQVLLDEITLGSGDEGPTRVFLPLTAQSFPQFASSDAYEPDDDDERMCFAWPAPLERSERHNFHLAGDQDRFCVLPPQGARYVVETVDLGARCDTVLTISNLDGSFFLENDNGGEGLASRIEWIVPEYTAYWISVRHKNGAVYGQGTEYTISIESW